MINFIKFFLNEIIILAFFCAAVFIVPVKASEIKDIDPMTDFNMEKVISGSVKNTVDMTMDNCIKIALGNNPQISAAFNDILAQDARIKQVWANYFPQINWQTSYSHIKQLQLSDAFGRNLQFDYYLLGQVGLQQLLYDFGVVQNQATIQRLGYESEKKTFASIVNDVIYQTKSAYYSLQYAYEAEKVAQNNLDNYQTFYNQAKALYKIGFNPKVDVTIAQANLSKAKMTLINAKNQVNTGIVNLNNVMGVPYLEKYKIQGELNFVPLDMSFEDTVKMAIEARPELKQAQIDVEKAHQNLKLAKKAYFPSLTAEGQYQKGGKHWTSNDGWVVGIYFNFPNVNAMLINNSIKEAKFLYDKEIANAKNIQNNIYKEIQTAYLKLHEKENQLPVAQIQVKEAQENYDLSKGRYRVGEATPIEMREAQNTLAESQLQYYNALYEYNSARAELEKAIGKNLIPVKNGDIVDFKK
ncbi:MAG: TolC family protein [Cyanobacteriota bacterium]|nr:TolC family protein [Cyanobacteriota bacterium]MDY6358425.1 TolC family protein [Cyanobacteriota bacterium]MDY6364691.1 TolC family protein [Cyanobacteriota bacterium]